MNSLRSVRNMLCTSVAAALLAGCGGSQPPIGVPSAMSQSRTIAMHGERGGSWMLPEATRGDLLYASDNKYGVVLAYSYPRGRMVGELRGFPAKPAGLCSDASGNVYVTTQGNGKTIYPSYIYEYAHGGTNPIGTLTDPGTANGCAVDPTTGNLAVTNYGTNSNVGDIAVYQGAQGTPQTYSDPNFQIFAFCTYDNAGNLFADGRAPVNVIDELPSGGNTLLEIQLSKDVYPGSIQWVRKQLVLAQVEGTSRGQQPIYQVQVSGSVGSVHGPILLSGPGDRRPVGDVQFWTRGTTIIGPDFDRINGLLGFWNYPQGGMPTKIIRPGLKRAFLGVTVSVAPR